MQITCYISKHVFPFISIWAIATLITINGRLCAQTRDLNNPPNEPEMISGNDSVCINDTTSYTIDLPLNCIANWYINGALQLDTGNILIHVWDQPGINTIEAIIICDTSSSPAGSAAIFVTDLPSVPGSISGDDNVCIASSYTYYTTIGENETCLWYVDGIIQISNTTSMSYYWTEIGNHTIEVFSENQCGISLPQNLEVLAFNYPEVYIGNDTTLYEGQTLLLDAGNPGSDFLWTTGDTTQTLLVSDPGTYGVTVSNSCGSAYDDIIVDFYTYIEEIATYPYIISKGIIYFTNEVASYSVFDLMGRSLIKNSKKEYFHMQEKGIYIVNIKTRSGKSFVSKVIMP